MEAKELKGNWNQMKGEIRKAWGKLSNYEVEQTHGDFLALKGLIQQRYGHSQDDNIAQKLAAISDRYVEKAKKDEHH